MVLQHTSGSMRSRQIYTNWGIFQGDSLSPLLFCIALTLLRQLLKKNTGYGYKIENTQYSHLLYMYDIKLYASNDSQLEGLLHTVKQFSDDINMKFRSDKCAKVTFKRGTLKSTQDIVLNRDTVIKELEAGELYKYLGVNEGEGIQHATMKEKICKEYPES